MGLPRIAGLIHDPHVNKAAEAAMECLSPGWEGSQPEDWAWLPAQSTACAPAFGAIGRHFFLYDFLFNDSVIRRVRTSNLSARNNPAVNLQMRTMGRFSDLLYDLFGHCSVTYGLISPELSEKIVRWKNPKLPSLHRWDDGSAADFVFHEQYGWRISRDYRPLSAAIPGLARRSPPVTGTPARIMQALNSHADRIERAITYSESEAICIATPKEGSHARKKMYLNVYQGRQREKPLYLSGQLGSERAATLIGEAQLHEGSIGVKEEGWRGQGWRGQGWPSYHGRGKRQIQHIRLHPLVLLSDLVRHPEILSGKPSFPSANAKAVHNLRAAGFNIGRLLSAYYLVDTAPQHLSWYRTQTDPSRISLLLDYYAAAPKADPARMRVPRMSILGCFGVYSSFGSILMPSNVMTDVDHSGKGTYMIAVFGNAGPPAHRELDSSIFRETATGAMLSYADRMGWQRTYLDSRYSRDDRYNSVVAVRVPTTVDEEPR